MAGTRERFLFPLLGCCPADMADVEGGCWQAQMMTNVAAGSFVHPTGTLSFEAAQAAWSRQLVQTFELLLALELQQKWGILPQEVQGPTDHTAATCLQWKLNNFQLWSMQRAVAWHSLAAGAQISLHAFEVEVMVLHLRACIGQI